MEVVNTVVELKNCLNIFRKESKKIGFVPTMGALHSGHIELVLKAAIENDIVVCSIFVNPTQFNNPEDLEKYPRMVDKDIEMLKKAGCHIVFIPSYEEVYPRKEETNYDFGSLETVLEGEFRPRHFKGVGMVVRRLFDIVEPHNAYFGLKDYQQFLVIKKLVEQFNIPVNIIGCPTVREKDGLAMSSRNLRLTDSHRRAAPIIYESLNIIKGRANDKTVKEWEQWFRERINQNPYLKLEYFEIANAQTLEKIDSWEDSDSNVACTAVFAGEVRLIDNVLINL